MVSILDVNFLLKVAQLVEFWLVTPEVAGSYPVLQPISHPKCRGFIVARPLPLSWRILGIS